MLSNPVKTPRPTYQPSLTHELGTWQPRRADLEEVLELAGGPTRARESPKSRRSAPATSSGRSFRRCCDCRHCAAMGEGPNEQLVWIEHHGSQRRRSAIRRTANEPHPHRYRQGRRALVGRGPRGRCPPPVHPVAHGRPGTSPRDGAVRLRHRMGVPAYPLRARRSISRRSGRTRRHCSWAVPPCSGPFLPDALLDALDWIWPPALSAWWPGRSSAPSVISGAGPARLLNPVLAVLVLFALGGAYQTIGRATEPRVAMRGELVDVGLFLTPPQCTGSAPRPRSSSPAAGVAATLGWIAPTWPPTTVCVYDRAGKGWSDAPQTAPDGGDRDRPPHAARTGGCSRPLRAGRALLRRAVRDQLRRAVSRPGGRHGNPPIQPLRTPHLCLR